ncbi:hypothetical protein HDV03_001379 [Kappamyces sp. JEL0829]|nr:hypothetical protein HDV03_001379 [Kappamyces sp. JEL0829]
MGNYATASPMAETPMVSPLDLFLDPQLASPFVDQTFEVPMLRSFSTSSSATVPGALLTPAWSPVTVSAPPPPAESKSRKRKEQDMSHDELLNSVEDKRRRNTESARRSRAKKLERMQELEAQVNELSKENAKMKALLAKHGLRI